MSLFLTGEFRHAIDDKMRFRIPVKLRLSLGEEPLITAGPDGSLLVMPYLDAANQIKDAFGDIKINSSSVSSKHLKEARLVLSSAFRASEDAQGRIVLPANLIKHASIKKNIVTIGMMGRVEIWAEEKWEAYLKQEVADSNVN